MTPRCSEPRRLCDGLHRREVAVHDYDRDERERVTCWVVFCECDDGRAAARAHVERPEKARPDWRPPSRIRTLPEMEAAIRRTVESSGRRIWWYTDPSAGGEDRAREALYTEAERVRLFGGGEDRWPAPVGLGRVA